jgi:diguanylate cyclase (GGDEF)-like protein
VSSAARIYYWGVVATAAAATAVALLLEDNAALPWLAFAAITLGLGATHLKPVPGRYSIAVRTTELFFAAGAILLPAHLAAAAAILGGATGWITRWRGRVKEVFNVSEYALIALAGWAAFHAALHVPLPDGPRFAVAATALVVVLPAVNHLLLGLMLSFAEGIRVRDVLARDDHVTAFGTGAIGVAGAVLWHTSPWVVPFAVVPVLTSFQALALPRLALLAATDAKTKLYNAARVTEATENEVAAAQRTRRPVSAVLVDLDLLREINNSRGHLAGDAVLVAVADVIRRNVRAADVAARFGGEEFAVLLPNTSPADALAIAERIRRGVEELVIEYGRTGDPLRATVSIGVASFPENALDAESLVHAADLALYRDKDGGRNAVVAAAA